MSEDQKQHYLDLEQKDRERFEKESAEADVVRLEEQEARRKALTVQAGEDSRSRGARQKLDEERNRVTEDRERRRQQREAEMDDDERAERDRLKRLKRQETEERQRKRAEEEQALDRVQKKLDKEDSKKAASRLEYLFKQSPIFAKLKMGKGAIDDEPEGKAEEEKKENGGRNGRGRKAAAAAKKPHHIHDKESAGEEEEEEEEEEDQHVFLTKQPNCIKFGQLKPYQIESLNWMIHLAEKGLNGILADEVRFTEHRPRLAIPLLVPVAQPFHFLYTDGTREDTPEYFDYGLPLGISENPRPPFDCSSKVDAFQLDE